jgi:hypothetical protein
MLDPNADKFVAAMEDDSGKVKLPKPGQSVEV